MTQNIAAQYAQHAQSIVHGQHPAPRRALLIEYDAAGNPTVHTFGFAGCGDREAIDVLADVMKTLNAAASN